MLSTTSLFPRRATARPKPIVALIYASQDHLIRSGPETREDCGSGGTDARPRGFLESEKAHVESTEKTTIARRKQRLW